MKKLFIENKVLFILTIIIIICFCVIIGALLVYFYSGSGTTKYGNRLEGAGEYKISENINDTVAALYSEQTYINKINVDVKGKIIYVEIDLKESLSLEDARSAGIKSLEAFTEEEKDYYDVQVIITTDTIEEKAEFYPMLGYLNAKKASIVWTNN